MIEFSLAYALALIFVSAFLPGAILSFGILRKSDFSFIEKLISGFAFGWILQGFLPFAEFLLLGIKFSYSLALANTAILYLIALAVFFWKKAHEDFSFKLPDFDAGKLIIPAALVLIFILNFWVRVQSLSPIYQELDPYYYLYVSQQIVTQGFNPLGDMTAWYPIAQVSHRAAPINFYSLATWYSLYTQASYNNYILSLVGNIYPPFAAAFAAFFLYLGLRSWYREEYALIASIVASFIPIFLLKLAAGEAEVQPYAFFSLALFIAFFLWAHKKQNYLYMALAGIGYFAVSLGSGSEVVATIIFLLFTLMQSLALFLEKKDMEKFAKLNLVFLAFALLAAILKSIFFQNLSISYAAVDTLAVAFPIVLMFIGKSKLEAETQYYAIGAVALAGILLFAFTPLGGIVKGVALTGLQLSEYNKPLDRTIAEQGTSGAVFEPSLGFIGKLFDHGIYIPIGYALGVFSFLANAAFSLFSLLLNAVVGVNLAYTDKDNSLLMVLLFFIGLASFAGLYRAFVKKEETPVLFFIAMVFPISLVGLLKAKYIIYLGFVVAAALAFALGELELLTISLIGKISEDRRKSIFYAFLAIGLVIAMFQFVESSAPALVKASFGTRFQDNPLALQQKFSDLCDQLRLKGINSTQSAEVCAAGQDPIAFANKSINNQYNYDLCVFSLIQDPFSQTEDMSGASLRCERVTDYWMDSMEWLRYHTENGSRVTSWWDYGHWENFFGQRNAVIRNEHISPFMIGEIANDYINATPAELKADMEKYNSTYALFDSELLLSGNSFGGKYGALNYLSCARNNQTDVTKDPGASMCEFEHLWTQVYIPVSPGPQDSCDISFEKKGVTAYALTASDNGAGISYSTQAAYCAGLVTLADGTNVTGLYDMNSRSASGDLKLHKAFMKYEGNSQYGNWSVYTLIYTHDKVWMENGNATDGWEDRTGKFYDSNIYSAFVLENLPGFQLVYKTPDGAVKIYKISS